VKKKIIFQDNPIDSESDYEDGEENIFTVLKDHMTEFKKNQKK